jgi:hypothetical protein
VAEPGAGLLPRRPHQKELLPFLDPRTFELDRAAMGFLGTSGVKTPFTLAEARRRRGLLKSDPTSTPDHHRLAACRGAARLIPGRSQSMVLVFVQLVRSKE